eukprot:3940106-Prymnesium_polylepis.2
MAVAAAAASSGSCSLARNTAASTPSIATSPDTLSIAPSRACLTLAVVVGVGLRAAAAVISKPAIALSG